MARFAYFLKSEVPSAQGRSGKWMFAWAEGIEAVSGGLRTSNLQVAISQLQDGALRLASHPLTDRFFHGFAYRMPEPVWFKRRQVDGPEANSAEPSRHEVARLMAISPLGAFCRHPAIARAFAQERLAEAIAPYLGLPDFLVHEDRLIREWTDVRPKVAEEVNARIAADTPFPEGCSEAFRAWRRRLRLAAFRRIDAAAVGREVFEPCPALFGEAYLNDSKAGIVTQARYWPKFELEARSRRDLRDPALLARTEEALSPLVALSLPRQARAHKAWVEVGALRDFETSCPLPLFPRQTLLPPSVSIPGYTKRFSADQLGCLGATDLTVVAAGLSPWEADLFSCYCSAHESFLRQLSEKSVELAQSKWSSGPPIGIRGALDKS